VDFPRRKIMPAADSSSFPRGSVPGGYREVFHWNISQFGRRLVLIQLLAAVLFFLGMAVFLLLAIGMGRIDWTRGLETVPAILEFPYRMGVEIGRQLAGASSGAGVRMALQALGNILLVAGSLLGSQLLVAFLHEGTHGLTMMIFGARPTFGFLPGGAMFFATSPGYAYTRAQYSLVAIAPLAVLNLLFLLALFFPVGTAGSAILVLLAALNSGGAIGDLWVLAILRKFPPQAYVMDEKDGMRVFLPATESERI
jgi:hypothetical protein